MQLFLELPTNKIIHSGKWNVNFSFYLQLPARLCDSRNVSQYPLLHFPDSQLLKTGEAQLVMCVISLWCAYCTSCWRNRSSSASFTAAIKLRLDFHTHIYALIKQTLSLINPPRILLQRRTQREPAESIIICSTR